MIRATHDSSIEVVALALLVRSYDTAVRRVDTKGQKMLQYVEGMLPEDW